jgi:hypothetical protein
LCPYNTCLLEEEEVVKSFEEDDEDAEDVEEEDALLNWKTISVESVSSMKAR